MTVCSRHALERTGSGCVRPCERPLAIWVHLVFEHSEPLFFFFSVLSVMGNRKANFSAGLRFVGIWDTRRVHGFTYVRLSMRARREACLLWSKTTVCISHWAETGRGGYRRGKEARRPACRTWGLRAGVIHTCSCFGLLPVCLFVAALFAFVCRFECLSLEAWRGPKLPFASVVWPGTGMDQTRDHHQCRGGGGWGLSRLPAWPRR